MPTLNELFPEKKKEQIKDSVSLEELFPSKNKKITPENVMKGSVIDGGEDYKKITDEQFKYNTWEDFKTNVIKRTLSLIHISEPTRPY